MSVVSCMCSVRCLLDVEEVIAHLELSPKHQGDYLLLRCPAGQCGRKSVLVGRRRPDVHLISHRTMSLLVLIALFEYYRYSTGAELSSS